jgi:two-component system, OmpR family, sensor histidine kinase CpxA
MTRLFLKIFMWFWVTVVLTGIALVAIVMFQNRQIRPQDHEGLIQTVRYFGTAAAKITQDQGVTAGTAYLTNLSRDVRIRACLFNEAGQTVAGVQCETFTPLIRGIQHGAGSEFSMPNGTVRIAVRVAGKNQKPLLFASEMPVAPRAMLQSNLASILLRGAFALFVSGCICYALARFLTRPVLNLSFAAQRITAGDLGVRADERLVKRRDELGDLVQDFNCMADTNQRVISRQRQLLYDISHELRSPLTRMNVAIDLLRGRVGEDAALARIETDTERLNELIGRLLTVTKLENTSTLLHPSRLVLSDLVCSIASDADFEAQKAGSHVRVISKADISLQGDYGLLRSAIENVVRNAVKHTDPNTSVDIHLEGPNGADSATARITVRDYGNGVPDEELSNIFEPFYRVIDTDRDNDEGVGLGLSITDRVIRLHGGTIHASNATDGRGLMVTIRLPLVQHAC